MKILRINFPFIDKIGWNCIYRQTEKIFDLRGKYNDSNSTCKTNNEWIGNKFQKISKPCKPHSYEHNSRHKGGNDQSIDSMILYNCINNNDKCTRRPSDLNPTSS